MAPKCIPNGAKISKKVVPGRSPKTSGKTLPKNAPQDRTRTENDSPKGVALFTVGPFWAARGPQKRRGAQKSPEDPVFRQKTCFFSPEKLPEKSNGSASNDTYHQGPASTLAGVAASQDATQTLVSQPAVVASSQLAAAMPPRKTAVVPSSHYAMHTCSLPPTGVPKNWQ